MEEKFLSAPNYCARAIAESEGISAKSVSKKESIASLIFGSTNSCVTVFSTFNLRIIIHKVF